MSRKTSSGTAGWAGEKSPSSRTHSLKADWLPPNQLTQTADRDSRETQYNFDPVKPSINWPDLIHEKTYEKSGKVELTR